MLRTVSLCLMLLTSSFAFVKGADDAAPLDMVEAMALCDTSDLRPVEGIWSFPEDDVTVLVFRNPTLKGVYDLTVVESADCSLNSGERLGQLRSSVDPDKYTLELFTSKANGVFSAPCSAVATYSDSKETLTVKRDSRFNLRLNPTRLLPSFWRLVSISIKQKESAPEGMFKIYPSYDGNGSTKRGPRYL